MRTKEDARVIRTKAKLFDAFRELLSEKTFEEITINEICVRAEIRRATFYKHFSDKYDFLAALTNELRGRFEERFWNNAILKDRALTDYYIEYLKVMVDFLDRNYPTVNLIFKSNMTSTLIDVIVDENYKKTKEKLEADVANGLSLIASPDTLSIYLSGGISNTVIKWLKDGKKTPREDLISELSLLISAAFGK